MTNEHFNHGSVDLDPTWTDANGCVSPEDIDAALDELCGDDSELLSLVRLKCGYDPME
jgi:hypothetical protein